MLEARRREGAGLLAAGLAGTEVARRLGVSAAAVSGWRRRLSSGGPGALAARSRPGRPPRAPPGVRPLLQEIIAQGPRRSGLAAERWTLPLLAAAVQRRWSVAYSRSALWRILRQAGYRWVGAPNRSDRLGGNWVMMRPILRRKAGPGHPWRR